MKIRDVNNFFELIKTTIENPDFIYKDNKECDHINYYLKNIEYGLIYMMIETNLSEDNIFDVVNARIIHDDEYESNFSYAKFNNLIIYEK